MKILPTPETVHWGFFDAGLQPVATIDSGDTVTISTVSGGRDDMPPDGFDVPQALRDIQAAGLQPDAPGHICTGPVAINGAEPGDVLEVKIEAIDLSYGWGYTFFRPGSGALPDDFPARETFHSKLDKERMIATLPWGQELPLAPFFGVMAVAPTADQGRISTIPPRVNGGNMDNKELVAGTTLYLPVQVPGALFSAGDGHGCQGDGEVCVTAIETGLVGTFKLTVRKDMTLDAPQAETDTHLIAMAFDEDLDEASRVALRRMIDWVSALTGLSRGQAYALCSLVADVRVTQVVNGNKGIHVMFPKARLVTV
jgi:acetamidase/formamidase